MIGVSQIILGKHANMGWSCFIFSGSWSPIVTLLHVSMYPAPRLSQVTIFLGSKCHVTGFVGILSDATEGL